MTRKVDGVIAWRDPEMTLDDIPVDDIAQYAFSAYVDASQAEGHAHKRLEAGSRAAARAVAARLIDLGIARHKVR